MKSYLLAVGLLILLCPTQILSQKNFAKSTVSSPVDQGWLQQAEKRISEMEYDFNLSKRSAFEFYAANRKQRIGFTFTKDGYTVAPINFTANDNS